MFAKKVLSVGVDLCVSTLEAIATAWTAINLSFHRLGFPNLAAG